MGHIVDIFTWTWNSGVAVQGIHQNSKNGYFHCFNEEFVTKNDFKVVLATFCCYGYGVNASEAVGRIATDQNDYYKCFFCVTVCCRAKTYH